MQSAALIGDSRIDAAFRRGLGATNGVLLQRGHDGPDSNRGSGA